MAANPRRPVPLAQFFVPSWHGGGTTPHLFETVTASRREIDGFLTAVTDLALAGEAPESNALCDGQPVMRKETEGGLRPYPYLPLLGILLLAGCDDRGFLVNPDDPLDERVVVISDDVVVVDSVSTPLLSDSLELEAGLLRFDRSRGAPDSILPGQVLVGTQSGGFLRRVTGVSEVDGIILAETIPAAMEEAIERGGFSIDFGNVTSGRETALASEGVSLLRLGEPELASEALGSIRLDVSESDWSQEDVKRTVFRMVEPLKIGGCSSDGSQEDEGDVDLCFIWEDGAIEVDFFVNGDEATRFDVRFGEGQRSLDFVLDGELRWGGTGRIEASQNVIPSEDFDVDLPFLVYPFAGVVGVVPVVGDITVGLRVKVDWNVSAAGSFTYPVAGGRTFQVGALYDRQSGWSALNEGERLPLEPGEFTSETSISAEASISIKPKVKVTLYRAVGADAAYGYFHGISAFAGVSGSEACEWNATISHGLRGSARVFTNILWVFSLEYSVPFPSIIFSERSFGGTLGTTVVAVSGDDQTGAGGSPLPEPVVVRVVGASGAPQAGREVTFSVLSGAGGVQPSRAFTSQNGTAQTLWTLGDTPGTQRLRARAGPCSTPVEFSAQNLGGTIRGQLRDVQTLDPIPAATVNLTEIGGSGFQRSTQTDGTGRFEIVGVPAGVFRLVVDHPDYQSNTAQNLRIVESDGLSTVTLSFELPPLDFESPISQVQGIVRDAQTLSPLSEVEISISGGPQTNGFFRTVQTDASGNFTIGGIPLNDPDGNPIQSFILRARAPGYATGFLEGVSLTANETLTNQDFLLQTATDGAIIFASGFEAGAEGWSFDGMWNRTDGVGIRNTLYPTYVRLAPDDTTDGFLPSAPEGNFYAWYGDPGTGSFIGTQAPNDQPGSGGSSTTSNSGLLRSQTIELPAGEALVLEYETWFEVESVNPRASGFDRMDVLLTDVETGVVHSLGRLNPFVDPNVPNRNAIPFTSGGFNRAPEFRGGSHDLSEWAGRTVRIGFRFDTRDRFYNGFRGWIVDDVRISIPAGGVVGPFMGMDPSQRDAVGYICGDEWCFHDTAVPDREMEGRDP